MKTPGLISNITALSFLQVLSFTLPLLTIPYIARILGPEHWGAIALSQLIIGYFVILSNWGFLWSATKKVAAAKGYKKYLLEIFWSTWIAQWLLCITVSILLVLAIEYIPYLNKRSLFYYSGILSIVAIASFPVWFFQGMELMKEFALIQLIGKILVIPLTFIFIKEPNDGYLVIVISGGTAIVSGIFSIYWLFAKLDLEYRAVSFLDVFKELRESFGIFLSTLWISVYTSLTPVILGSISGTSALANFTLASRAQMAAQSALTPISQALYPRMSSLYGNNPKEARRLLLKSAIVTLPLAASFSLVLAFFSDIIVLLIGGEQYLVASEVLVYLSPLPLIVCISNFCGVQIMFTRGNSREFNFILGVAGAISLITIYPLIMWKGAIGAGANILITESIVSALMLFFVIRSRL